MHFAAVVDRELARALQRPNQCPQACGLRRWQKSAEQALTIRRPLTAEVASGKSDRIWALLSRRNKLTRTRTG